MKRAVVILNIGVVAFLLFPIALRLGADTLNVTWADAEWNTTWANALNSGACDTSLTTVYATTGGNPSNHRFATCQGKNDVGSVHHEWASTWEALGVTAGNVVSTIQMVDVDTQATTDTNCDTQTVGPFELRDSANALVSTMWAGRTATVVEASWTAEGADAAQSVGSLTASTANIELWFNTSLDIANTSGSRCDFSIDNLDIAVVHSTPPATLLNRFLIGNLRKYGTYETRVSMFSGAKSTRKLY